jgi:hypothetical protein
MTSIGIVGAGIAGLHLGLYLLEHGLTPTLYTDRTAGELRGGRLPNTVALGGNTRARERVLRINHWDSDFGMFCVYMRIGLEPPLAFRGNLNRPAIFIDMRLYLPRLLEDLAARGGHVVHAAPGPADLSDLAARHDLLVIATGRAGLSSLFPRVPERSPYTEPQRRLFAGLFHGIRYPDPLGLTAQLIPGHGEVFENQFLTAGGPISGLLIEAIPGGGLEAITRIRHEDDAAAFHAALLAALRDYAPLTFARVDPARFALREPLDYLQGSITPVARRGYATLEGGRAVLALGDAHITHDPITGQGANAASRAAWLLGEALVARAREGSPFGEAFCAAMEDRIWQATRATTEWTNAFLQPPPPHAARVLVAAAQHQAVADAFADGFDEPDSQWAALSTPEGAEAFLQRLGASGG